MADKFKTGDIVQLKSGGPKMTVVGVSPYDADQISTAWFAGAKREVGVFPIAALNLSKDEAKS